LIRPRLLKLAAPVLLLGASFFCGAQVCAQQTDLRAAAAAKAAAGREARAHAAVSVPRASGVGTFTTFNAPGAVNGTFPSSINPAGAITGSSNDANLVGHGFLRARNGTFTTFDAPGAGTSSFQGTFPSSINPEGSITGNYVDANFFGHGFLRASNRVITTFDVPGAAFFLTLSINPAGAIAGTFFDANFVPHGFLRAKNGTLITFDAPGASSDPNAFPFDGTQPVGINPEGVIIGVYGDGVASHGFLRARDGTFTTFDAPGNNIRVFAPFSFGPDLSMNPGGVITGTYFQTIAGNPFGGNFRVFVLAPDGTLTTFDAATYPPCCLWSFPSGITPSGMITGSFNDGFTINHGFLRASDGTITTFDAPGAGTGFNQGTAPLGITPAGVIMGLYRDTNGVTHGFILTPQPSALSAKR
jgi:hypothetical protein